ncbi:hypothetical protein CHS0354_001233 [Potamilus streckersoni]|uniref:Carboxylesterase type B domain-containing protein n=1 Tax=Potamilus streckersoni TaxID=2493646 RepID=A0AAE0VNZ5_9BIVA|nr:hypothetical protein CHS0354_001233 [Potamilus streckersoni]
MFVCHVAHSQYVNTRTHLGTITGYVDDVLFDGASKKVTKFIGIPYAEAPVGQRRFTKPVLKKSVPSPYNATYPRPQCPQDTITGFEMDLSNVAEDCLNLNIYVPGESVSSNSRQFAVMIWIHGGGFILGSQDMYDGSVLSAMNNVIVVTLNYRLTVFGFLSTGDNELPGNYGLWDQHTAIRWVHDNIAAFGGDPERVTMFGESAGSFSVSYQALYPGNSGLVKRGIAQSGSTDNIRVGIDESQRNFQGFAKAVGCAFPEQSSTVRCLRSKTLIELVSGLRKNEINMPMFDFRPRVDGKFLQEYPSNIFRNETDLSAKVLKFFSTLDFISGVDSNDGTVTLMVFVNEMKYFLNRSINDGIPRTFFTDTIVPFIVDYLFKENVTVFTEAIIHEYTDWSDPDDPKKIRSSVLDLLTDYAFLVPAVKTLNSHIAFNTGSNTFMYQFSEKPFYYQEYTWLPGAAHSVELPYVFGFPKSMKIPLGIVPAKDIRLSKLMMSLWTKFAKTGNPNSPIELNDVIPVSWPKYDKNHMYLDLSTNMTAPVKRNIAPSRISLWLEVLPEILKTIHKAPSELPHVPVIVVG